MFDVNMNIVSNMWETIVKFKIKHHKLPMAMATILFSPLTCSVFKHAWSQTTLKLHIKASYQTLKYLAFSSKM